MPRSTGTARAPGKAGGGLVFSAIARVPDAAYAWGLSTLLAFGILTLWVEGRWALSVLEAGLFALMAVWLVDARHRLHVSFPAIVPGAAAALCLVQLLTGQTASSADTVNAALYWAAAASIVFLSFQVFQDAGIRRRSLQAILYFGFVLIVISTTQFFTSGGKVFWWFDSGYQDRVAGPFVYWNNYAAFIELLLPAALYETLRRRRKAATFAGIAAIMYASVIASGSRAGSVLATIEIAVVLLIVGLRSEVSWRTLSSRVAMLLTAVFVFSFVVGWGYLWRRFQEPDPYAGRRELISSSVAMVRERPWTGHGMGAFASAYPRFALFDPGTEFVVNHAHNDWAQWAAEGGIPFLLLMVSLAVRSALPLLRSGWGIGVLSVFAHGVVDYPMQRFGLAACVFLILGMAAAQNAKGISPSRRCA